MEVPIDYRRLAERAFILNLITKRYSKGIASVVSDTFNFWEVISEDAKFLKNAILAREGKVVFRPDSGDPVKIICGMLPEEDENDMFWVDESKPARKGAVECLWDIFGGTVNEKGFKVLDPHVGVIYGDSITLERAHYIMKGLEKKGFASSNIVFGVGSFTYQHVTRDTFGFAVKSTYGRVNGIGREIFKDPVTDSGTKKSAKGLISVVDLAGQLVLLDQQPEMHMPNDLMKVVFLDGHNTKTYSLEEIRKTILAS